MPYVASTVWYCGYTQWTAVSQWAASTSFATGKLIRSLTAPAVGSERVFVQAAGTTTSSTTEPTWPTTKSGMIADGGLRWYEVTGQPGVNGDTLNCPQWTASSTPPAGFIIYDPTSNALHICTTSAAGAATKPTFNTIAGTTTADGSAVWMNIGAPSTFPAFGAPFGRVQAAIVSGWMAAAHTCFVASNHVENNAAAISMTFPGTMVQPNVIVSTSPSAAPPTAPTSGALINSTSAGGNLTLSAGVAYFVGLTFQTNAAAGYIQAGLSWARYENCAFQKLGATASAQAIYLVGPSDLVNTTVKFGATGDGIRLAASPIRWRDTPNAIDPTGAIPTGMLGYASTAYLEFTGVDFSNITGASLWGANVSPIGLMSNCRFNPNTTTPYPTVMNVRQVMHDIVFSDSSGTIEQHSRAQYSGNLAFAPTVVRNNPNSNTPGFVSWLMTPNSSSTWYSPLEAFPITTWTASTSLRSITVYGVTNTTSLPLNDQIWMDVNWIGSAASPLSSFGSTSKASFLATGVALTQDTSDWNAPLRVNSTSYPVGSAINVASNPALIFFCLVSSGPTAATPPTAYQTASDGTVVTDGGCTFRAGWRFSLTFNFGATPPALAGDVVALVKGATAVTFYIDPQAVLQ